MFQSYVRYSQWIVAGYTSATHRWQAGKFPTLVQHSDNLETKVTEVRSHVPRLVVTMVVGHAGGHRERKDGEIR